VFLITALQLLQYVTVNNYKMYLMTTGAARIDSLRGQHNVVKNIWEQFVSYN